MKPKKVAVLYSGAKYWGGVETYLENLFNYADSSPVDLTLFSLGNWPLTKKIQISNFKFQIFSESRINPLTIFKIAKFLRAGNHDLVVSQGTVANAYARAASLFSGVPSLVTIHSDREGDYPNSFIRFIYELSDYVSRWRTTGYIAASEFLKQKTVSSGIAAEKIMVIYNGVAPAENLKSKFKKAGQDQSIKIGSIGRLHQVKNFEALIEAFGEMKKSLDISHFNLEIAGEGPERSNLEDRVTELKLNDSVKLLGHRENLMELFARWNIYVQPSISEGFGLSVIEAQMAGLPVVVTPGGALTELVADGETGVVASGFTAVDIAQAVDRFLEDPKLADKCAQNGQKVALERYDIKKWVKKTIDTYLKVAK